VGLQRKVWTDGLKSQDAARCNVAAGCRANGAAIDSI
jgi:hypothetical protein